MPAALLFCQVCNQNRDALFRFQKGVQPGTHAPFDIVECSVCGFQWATPVPSPQALAQYYADGANYTHYVHASELKREHFRLKLDELAPFLPPVGPMLDVGCATGFLIEAALERGWDARGIEMNKDIEPHIAPQTKPRISFSTLSALAKKPTYALMTLFDVLEHSPTPRVDLETCRELLLPGGVIVVQLPCTDSLGQRLFGKRWYHYGPPAHLSFFTSKSFDLLARSCGFEVRSERWTRKLFTLDYFASQIAHEYAHRAKAVRLPIIGSTKIKIPMSERLFVLAAKA